MVEDSKSPTRVAAVVAALIFAKFFAMAWWHGPGMVNFTRHEKKKLHVSHLASQWRLL
jgi:hypothetical protein